MTKLVIIGLGAAGFAAMLAAKKKDSKIDITVIDEKPYLLHSCGMPYALEGEVKISDLSHDIGADRMGVKLIEDSVSNIDTKGKEVELDGKKIKYDKLIISTGATTFLPPVEGVGMCYAVDNLDNLKKLEKDAKKAKSAVVIGAGAIGLEIAAALKNLGKKVTVIELRHQIMPNALDEDMAKLLQEKLDGIDFKLGEAVAKIEEGKLYYNDDSIKADLFVLAAGVRANIDLAEAAKIKCDTGVIVNEKMETSAKDVYAIGDCVQTKHFLTKEPCMMQLATSAYKQGTVAGTNAAGGELKYKGALNTFVSVIDGVEVASTGLMQANGEDVAVGKVKNLDKPEWYPDAKELIVKLVVEKKTRKIMGCQAIGAGAAHRVNIISTAIHAGMKIDDISDLELAYCPAVSQTYDILTMAADFAIRRLR